jgi:nicotinamide-nucleotide adenylyltransferase
MGTALFVGRFQPFHNGHLKAIREILEKEDSVVIVIGSAQEANTRENPFSVEERRVMIMRALQEAGIRGCRVTSVPDYFNDERWARAVLKVCKFDVVYTCNAWTERALRKKGFEVRHHKIHDQKELSGAAIRDRIVHGKKWRHLVPSAVAGFVEEYYGLQRVRKLHSV